MTGMLFGRSHIDNCASTSEDRGPDGSRHSPTDGRNSSNNGDYLSDHQQSTAGSGTGWQD